jgi:hypothetical protein
VRLSTFRVTGGRPPDARSSGRDDEAGETWQGQELVGGENQAVPETFWDAVRAAGWEPLARRGRGSGGYPARRSAPVEAREASISEVVSLRRSSGLA